MTVSKRWVVSDAEYWESAEKKAKENHLDDSAEEHRRRAFVMREYLRLLKAHESGETRWYSAETVEAITRARDDELAQLRSELSALRAAEEGAVTVEGYADLRVFNGSPWNTLRVAANMMRVFMEGIDGDIPVTVTIRRKP